MKKLLIAGVITAAITSSQTALGDTPLIASADLPAIPLSVTDPVRKRVPSSSQPQKAAASPEQASSEQAELSEAAQAIADIQAELRAEFTEKNKKPREPVSSGGPLQLEPGVNKIVNVSQGHPNRILLPFENPDIHTTSSEALIKAEASVVVLATNSIKPVTLFISPKDNPRLALSLTLVPKTMPPAQYEVSIAGELSSQYAYKNVSAEKWERKNNYTGALVKLFEKLAKQDLPQGYSLRDPKPHEPHSCFKPNTDIEWTLAQVVQGHHITVNVVVAKNAGNYPVEIIGSDCNAQGVIAAAEWPLSVLEPGDVTEVYVASQRSMTKAKRIRRPSAIGGVRGQN